MPHDVFVSYASEDKTVADAVCATLESRRVRCWIAPRDVVAGSEYGGAIVEAIASSRVLVLVLSARSNASKQVLREVERALSKGVAILPFRIEDIEPSGSMEYFLGGQHWLDALTPPLERHLGRLAESVEALLSVARRESHAAAPLGSPQPDRLVRSQPGLTSPRLVLVAGAVAVVAVTLIAVRPGAIGGLAAPSTQPGPSSPTSPPTVTPQATLAATRCDLSGNWGVNRGAQNPCMCGCPPVTLKQTGSALTGHWSNEGGCPVVGSIAGSTVSMRITVGPDDTILVDGAVDVACRLITANHTRPATGGSGALTMNR